MPAILPLLGFMGASAGLAVLDTERQKRQPRKIGELIGASASFDAMTELSPRQRRIMEDFDEKQVQQYQDAIAESTTNAVRLGQMSPDEARARVNRANFTLNPTEINNSGQLQQGAMTAMNLPDATSQLEDYNGLGLDNEYIAQLTNAAALRGNLTEDMGDQMISREFDRTVKYREPLENYRMQRGFAYQEKGLQNQMKRDQASNLLTGYANTAQQLMTSGL